MLKLVVGRIVDNTLELFTVEFTYKHYNLIKRDTFQPDRYYIYSDKTGYLYRVIEQKSYISENEFKEIISNPTAYTLAETSLFFWSDSPIVKAITSGNNNDIKRYYQIYKQFLDIKENNYKIKRQRNTAKMCGEKIPFRENLLYLKYRLNYKLRVKSMGRKMKIIW